MGTHTLQAFRRERSPRLIRMKTAMMSLLTLALCLVSTTVVSANEEERDALGCSADQLLNCISEIEKAFEDCSHLNSTDEIMVCINDILGATNLRSASVMCFPSSARVNP